MKIFTVFGELHRYVIVGVVVWSIELAIFYLLFYGGILGLVFANVLARTVSSFAGFFMHKSFTFTFDGKINTTHALKYIVLVCVNIPINTALLYAMQGLVDSPLCKPISDIVVIMGSFLVTKIYIFGKNRSVHYEK